MLAWAVFAAAALWFGTGLTPAWWWAWLAPIPLLWLAYTLQRAAQANVIVFGVSLLGATSYASYFWLLMPPVPALLATAGIACIWYAVVMGARAIVHGLNNGWSALGFPLLWVGADMLMRVLLPDGNWGSPAYAGATLLPLLQLASLIGVSGLLFVSTLVPSSIALLLWRGQRVRWPWVLVVTTLLLVASVVGFGLHRLHTPVEGIPVRIGLAAIDEPIDPATPAAQWQRIRERYEAMVAQLAAEGARVILLPERLVTLPPAELVGWQQHFSALASRHRVWMSVGVTEDGRHPSNEAWLFDAQGQLVQRYQKHFLAPPERVEDYARGRQYAIAQIDGMLWGLAVCKDMHFPSLGRANGLRDAAVMLVPAWDFDYRDARLAERITATRGVENGYAVVRSAREGLLSISDARGRTVLQARSAPFPGAMAVADLSVAMRVPTLYGATGDLFGWSAAVCAVVLLLASLRSHRRCVSSRP